MSNEATKGKSPYARKQKAPYRLSDQYHAWSKAVGDAGAGYLSEAAEAADRAFRRAFGVPSREEAVKVRDPRPDRHGRRRQAVA